MLRLDEIKSLHDDILNGKASVYGDADELYDIMNQSIEIDAQNRLLKRRMTISVKRKNSVKQNNSDFAFDMRVGSPDVLHARSELFDKELLSYRNG